jgi:hypothetical protein
VTALARIALGAVLLAGSLGACGNGSCSFPPVSSSPIDGVVVGVDSTGLTDVHGFTVRQSDGSSVVFQVGQLDDAVAFPPGHLKEHQATASPVRVYFRVANGRDLVAYHIEDASGAPATQTPISFACR